jgi:2-isopropylmalate synthase
VRIHSQSGKGGVALVLERDHGLTLPKWLHPAVSRVVQAEADATGEEISSRQIRVLFERHFLSVPEGWRLNGYDLHSESQRTHGRFHLAGNGTEVVLTGEGQGLIEALIDAVSRRFGVSVDIVEFDEHALSTGTEAKALASVTVEMGGQQASACCIDEDTSLASLQATLSAVGRALEAQALRRAI